MNDSICCPYLRWNIERWQSPNYNVPGGHILQHMAQLVTLHCSCLWTVAVWLYVYTEMFMSCMLSLCVMWPAVCKVYNVYSWNIWYVHSISKFAQDSKWELMLLCVLCLNRIKDQLQRWWCLCLQAERDVNGHIIWHKTFTGTRIFCTMPLDKMINSCIYVLMDSQVANCLSGECWFSPLSPTPSVIEGSGRTCYSSSYCSTQD